MGVDYSANLLVGIEVKKHLKHYQSTKQITKYNEDTGVPYQQSVVVNEYTLGTRRFTEEEWHDFEPPSPFELLRSDYYDNHADFILGLSVGGTNSNRSGRCKPKQIELEEITTSIAKVKSFGEKMFGISDVGVWVALEVS